MKQRSDASLERKKKRWEAKQIKEREEVGVEFRWEESKIYIHKVQKFEKF